MEARPDVGGEWACYHDRKSYYWAFVSGKSGDEAALYAVRRGVAVDGVTGEVEDTLPAGAAPARNKSSGLFAKPGRNDAEV